MSGSEHIFEVIGQSRFGECDGHVWRGEGRCPYCSDRQLDRQRNREITEMALAILEANLSKDDSK